MFSGKLVHDGGLLVEPPVYEHGLNMLPALLVLRDLEQLKMKRLGVLVDHVARQNHCKTPMPRGSWYRIVAIVLKAWLCHYHAQI